MCNKRAKQTTWATYYIKVTDIQGVQQAARGGQEEQKRDTGFPGEPCVMGVPKVKENRGHEEKGL